MTSSTSPVPRVLAFLESRQLGIAWVIAVVIGAVIISSNASMNPQRLVLPVIIMLVYGGTVYNRWSGLFATASQAYKLTIVAQLADSMYFMGFVWTLWALIDSFVIHQIDQADAIFRTFGYALVTTAVGMFCRLAILQFKYTATEQSQGAQASVEDLLLKFNATLNQTQSTLETWHHELALAAQAIKGANRDLITATTEVHRELSATITDVHNGLQATLLEAQAGLERTIRDTGVNLQRTIQENLAKGLNDFGRQTSANLDLIREATTGLVSTLKRTNTGLGKSITDLTDKIAATTQAVNDSAMQVSKAPRELQKASEELVSALQDAAKAISATTATTTSTWTATVTTASTTLSSATAKLATDLGGLSREIETQLTLGIEGITVSPHVALTVDEPAIAAAISTGMTPVKDELSEVKQTLRTVRSGLETLRTTTGGLATKVESTAMGDEVRQVESRLQSSIVTLTARLERLQRDAEQPRPEQSGGERNFLERIFGRHGKDGQ
jgi:hypothetical protein